MSVSPAADLYEFTVEEYHKLAGVLFDEDDRVELLNGNIIVMSPIGIRHIWSVRRLTNLFVKMYGDWCSIDAQNAVALDLKSEPQPDVLLLRKDVDTVPRYSTPDDVLLLIEVSDSTFRFDNTDKRAAYARTGISEYWILDLVQNRLLVFRDSDGRAYQTQLSLEREECVAPLAFPAVPVQVKDLLPP